MAPRHRDLIPLNDQSLRVAFAKHLPEDRFDVRRSGLQILPERRDDWFLGRIEQRRVVATVIRRGEGDQPVAADKQTVIGGPVKIKLETIQIARCQLNTSVVQSRDAGHANQEGILAAVARQRFDRGANVKVRRPAERARGQVASGVGYEGPH